MVVNILNYQQSDTIQKKNTARGSEKAAFQYV